MGHLYKEMDGEGKVVAWSVSEIAEHLTRFKEIPREFLRFVRSKILHIGRDVYDNVIVESLIPGEVKILERDDILFIKEDEQLYALAGYQFRNQYVEWSEEDPVPTEPEYSLVMPFTTVISEGGEHDDASYTAGWEMGMLYSQLALLPHEMRIITIHTANLTQADLILMKYGYTSAKLEQDPQFPEWTGLVLIPNQSKE
jgi:hypothetical protein